MQPRHPVRPGAADVHVRPMTDTSGGNQGNQGNIGNQGNPDGLGGQGGQGGRGGQGIQGVPGGKGDPGSTGQRGLTGKAGPLASVDRHRMLFLFVSMFAIFGLLGWRSEINADGIKAAAHHQEVLDYGRCINRAVNIDKANAFYRGMAALEARNEFINAKLRAERVNLYSHQVYSPPDCGPKP